jgi:hypothetical protein
VANRRASVWKYVRIGKTWRYCRPVFGSNNRIKPHWVCVNGHKEHHPEGAYYIHFLENGRQVWKKIGANPVHAVKAAEFQRGYFQAIAIGVPIQNTDKHPLMISDTLHRYPEEYRLSQRPESYALMRQTLEEFVAFTRKNLIGRIDRIDLLRYKEWLMKRGRSARTAGNKMLRVNQYLRKMQGLGPGKGLVTVKDAKYTELEPEMYDSAELAGFFAACSAFQFRVFKTLFMSGLRKQELENLEWPDVSFTVGTITVSPKPGFEEKDWEQRTIEVPDELLDLLKPEAKPAGYVFTTRGMASTPTCGTTAARSRRKPD